MGQHKYQQKILPRFVDSDTEVRYMRTSEGAVRYMSNVRVGRRAERTKGASTNIRGTLSIPNALLPAGENECIGPVSNETGSFLVFFNWNSNNEHGIYLYNPVFEQPVQLLIKDTPENIILGFHRYFKIKSTKARIVQDEHLFFTDRYNSPRYIHIPTALNYKKKREWEIQQIDSDIIDFNVLNVKVNGENTIVYTGNNGTILQSNPKLRDYFEIDDCECSITLTEKIPGSCEISTGSEKLRIVPKNFYPAPHNERQIDLVCYPPSTAPTVVLKKDLKIRRNLLNKDTWQFRVKYVYHDNNESVWSSWSKLVNTSGGCEEEYNAIEIDYTDKIFDCLNDVNQLHLIQKVVIGYRNTNAGNLHSFVTIKQCDIPKGKQTYLFYNDIYASAEPEYDDKVKQFDSVPLQCGALTSVDNMLVAGDITENYEEECFDFDVEVKYHPKRQEQKYDGKFNVWIDIRTKSGNGGSCVPIIQTTENALTYYYGTGGDHEEMDQRLGTHGFVVYIAGTDNMAITKQIIAPGSPAAIANEEYGIVRMVTDDERDLIIDTMKSNENAFRQKAEFSGLKDGTYIVRVASHWCGYGNKLGKGEAYDLDNGLVYQKTSTNIDRVNGVGNVFEAVVTISNGAIVGQEPVFDVEDCTGRFVPDVKGQIEIGSSNSLIQGYVIDSASVSQVDVYAGVRVENAAVKLVRTREFTGNEKPDADYAITDHNGYFYALARVNLNDIGGNNKILVTKGKNVNWNDLSGNDGDMAILWNGDDPYEGNLTNLKDGTCGTFDNSGTGDNFSQQVVNNFIIPYLVSGHNVTDNFRTEIKGRLVTADGNPISNILVTATGTTRFDKTDVNGNFGIILYANSKYKADERTVKLIFAGDECNNANFVSEYTINLGRVSPPRYNSSNPYNIGDIVLDITYNDIAPMYYLKNGDTYDVGVTLMDRALRKTTVIHNDKKHRIRLPFTTEYIRDYFPDLTKDVDGNTISETTKAEGYFTFDLKTVTKPPVWATHLYLLRTEGQVYSDYVQMCVSDIKYVINYAEALNEDTGNMEPNPVTTTYSNRDANEIYLDLVASFTEYKSQNSDSQKGWTVEKGDRLRFLYKPNGELYDFIEVEIKEQRGNYFVIDNVDALEELEPGFVVELFRLKTKVTDKRYFEVAEHLKVINPYTGDRTWEYNTLSPNTGDAYRRVRKMVAKNEDERKIVSRIIEDMSPDDSFKGKDSDIGRSDFINQESKQLRRLGTIRYSDKILTDSNINRIRRFDPEQQVTSDNNYGAISILDSFKSILFVAQGRKCHTRYVGKSSVQTGNGGLVLSDPNRVLSDPDYLVDDYGCINPESYVRCLNFGTFYDAVNGCMVAYYAQNGLNNISGNDDRYQTSKYQDSVFKPIGFEMSKIPAEIYHYISQAHSVFNRQDNEMTICFQPITLSTGQDISMFNGTGLNSNIGDRDVKFATFTTSPVDVSFTGIAMCFDSESKAWIGERKYNAECFGSLSNSYYGFVGGNIHGMEQGDNNSYGNFFGVKYPAVVDVVMNNGASEGKFYTNWSVESNKKWSNPYVKIYNSRAFRDIESRTPDAKIIRKQGVFYAPFMYDANTPNVQNPLVNGNRLVGETILMRLENNDTDEAVLFAVNIFAGYAGRSGY